MDLSGWYLVVRLLVAAGLGAIVGLERETRNKPAGLRTNMLVALGAAAFTLATVSLMPDRAVVDPGRIIQGVATGIGFLGAGSIFRTGDRVEGLTTAAGIWVVGALGAACGLGEYAVAVPTAIISLVVLTVVDKLERRFIHTGEG